MSSLINREEIRRLEKAAREKNKKHLAEWAQELEMSIMSELQRKYEQIYQDQLAQGVDTFLLAVVYTLNRDSGVNIKDGKMPFFLDNLLRNIDRFRTGEVTRLEYEKCLSRDHIEIKDYDYHHRITDIVAVVATDEMKKEKDNVIAELKNNQSIVLELDNKIDRSNEAQIHKNVDMINMCTRMYFLGESDDIETYIQAAQMAGKPVLEFVWKDDEDESI